jgi:cyclopropane-fatty-acyl-phospholipid synthase
MLYKFKSQADSDLFMNQAPAERILAIIGKEPAAQGIIEPADMAAAIAKLEKAVAEDDAARVASTAPTSVATAPAGAAGAQAITLHQRAWPFIQLLKRSLAADKPIVWGV